MDVGPKYLFKLGSHCLTKRKVSFLLYIYVFLRTACERRAEIFIQIRIPLSYEKKSLFSLIYLCFAENGPWT